MTPVVTSALMLVLAGVVVAIAHWVGERLGKRANRRAHAWGEVSTGGETKRVVERSGEAPSRVVVVRYPQGFEISDVDEEDEKMIEDFRSFITALSEGRTSFDDLT